LLLAFHHPIDMLAKPKPRNFEEWRNRTAAEQAKAHGHLEIHKLLKSFEPSDDLIETSKKQAMIKFNLRKLNGELLSFFYNRIFCITF